MLIFLSRSPDCHDRGRRARSSSICAAGRYLDIGLQDRRQHRLHQRYLCCFNHGTCLFRNASFLQCRCGNAQSTALYSVAPHRTRRPECGLHHDRVCSVLLLWILRCISSTGVCRRTFEEDLIRHRTTRPPSQHHHQYPRKANLFRPWVIAD